jgi:hypothetical protein
MLLQISLAAKAQQTDIHLLPQSERQKALKSLSSWLQFQCQQLKKRRKTNRLIIMRMMHN